MEETACMWNNKKERYRGTGPTANSSIVATRENKSTENLHVILQLH